MNRDVPADEKPRRDLNGSSVIKRERIEDSYSSRKRKVSMRVCREEWGDGWFEKGEVG